MLHVNLEVRDSGELDLSFWSCNVYVDKFLIYLHHAGTSNIINIYREDREEAIGIPVGYSVDNNGFSDNLGGHGGLDS